MIDDTDRSGHAQHFELECRPDDWASPTTVTVYTPQPEATTTEWLTIDSDHAVPVEELR
jgi:hypothetical protein